MKRILTVLLLCIGMTLVACGKSNESTVGNPTDSPIVNPGKDTNNQQNGQQNNQQNDQQNDQQNNQQNNQQSGPQYERHVRTDERWTADVDFVCDYGVASSFLTADYALYHDNTGRLQIFDVASKTDIVYCFDAACDHAPAKTSRGQVIKKGCIAYTFTSGNVPVKIQGDKCYFLKDTGEVCVSDRQGENRKTICKIPSYVIPAEVFFSGDAMFITYNIAYEMVEIKDDYGNSEWILGEPKDEDTCGIVMVDLSDGSCTQIFRQEAYNGRISKYDVRNGHVYFQFFYLDIPFVGPNLETYGPSGAIPDGLTVENYWEEMPKHQWEDVYDYDLHTGELKPVLTKVQGGTVVFCEESFAVAEKATGTTGLYNYNGELICRLNFEISTGVHTDSGLVCIAKDESEVYKMVDEKTGQIMKQTTISYGKMLVSTIIGGSCYGIVKSSNGYGAGYLSEADFWAGKYENAIVFNVFNETNGY